MIRYKDYEREKFDTIYDTVAPYSEIGEDIGLLNSHTYLETLNFL